jgi:hypothetical protein
MASEDSESKSDQPKPGQATAQPAQQPQPQQAKSVDPKADATCRATHYSADAIPVHYGNGREGTNNGR